LSPRSMPTPTIAIYMNGLTMLAIHRERAY
jgi:hypothetical protein